MLARSRLSLSALLAVTLSFSPLLSCYAYADDSSYSKEISSETSDYGEADRQLDQGFAQKESAAFGEFGESAADGQAEEEILPEDSYGSVPSSSASSVLDFSDDSADAFSYGSGGGDSSSASSLDDGPSVVESYLDDIVSLLGELVDYQRSSSGLVSLATVDENILSRLISIDNKMEYFTLSRGTTSNSSRINWELNGNKWNTTSTGIPWLLSWMLTNISSINSFAAQINQKSSYIESAYSLLGKQWGVGFGGTVVSYDKSPYRFLQNLSDRTYFLRGSSSSSGYSNWSIRSNNWSTPTTGIPWLLSFIAEIDNSINNNVLAVSNDLTSSYVLDGETYSNKSVAAILAHLINVQYWEAFDIKRVKENTSGLSTSMQLTGLPAGESTIAQIARYIHNNMVASYVIDGETYSNKSVAAILAHLINVQYWEAFDIKRVKENTSGLSTSMQLTGLPAGESTIAQIARYIHNNMVASYVIDGETHSNKSVAQMLAEVVNSSYWASDKLSRLYASFQDLQKIFDSFFDGWNTQDSFLVDWLSRFESVQKGSSWSDSDKLSLFAKLDGISNRLSVMAAKDVLDTFVGDLDTPATSAALSRIQDAMGRAFPFCIPSVVNMVLFGSVLAEPVPPCWEFDIVGTPLIVDFAPYDDFAEVCRWVVRLLFTGSLLMGTRRFIYGFGGGE